MVAFKYISQILTSTDYDCLKAMANQRKSRENCAWMSSILVHEGANVRISSKFFKSVMQSVFLFRSEFLVVTPHVVILVESSHHREILRLKGKQPLRLPDGIWE